MKVLLTNTPWYTEEHYGVRAGARWPHLIAFNHFENRKRPFVPFPFFMAYAAAVLKNKGHEVYVIDAVAQGLDEVEFLARVMEIAPDVSVQEVSTPTLMVDLYYAERIKKICEGTTIIFCGPNHLMHSERFLDANKVVDIVIYGEYEHTLRNIVNELDHENATLKMINGIIYRDSGRVIKNPPAPLIENLDTLPWPARELLPLDRYQNASMGLPYPRLQVWSSRGCPFICNFCNWPQMMYGGANYRVRKAKDIVEEIAFCVKKWKYKSFYFNDDTFNLGRKNLLELAGEIKKHRIRLPFSLSPRADSLDEEQLLALKDAGLYSIKLGIESGSQELLDSCGKALDLEKVEHLVSLAKENNIKVYMSFTLGLPGETDKTINETIDYALRLDPTDVVFTLLTPSPGSEYYKELDEKGYILSKNWDDYDGFNPSVFKTDNLESKDIEKALKKANTAWKAQLHVRNMEFDLNSVKKQLSFLTNDDHIVIFTTSFSIHLFEIINALPGSIDTHTITIIAPEEQRIEVESEFIEQSHLFLPGTGFNRNDWNRHIEENGKKYFFVPVDSAMTTEYDELIHFLEDKFPKQFMVITKNGEVFKKSNKR